MAIGINEAKKSVSNCKEKRNENIREFTNKPDPLLAGFSLSVEN